MKRITTFIRKKLKDWNAHGYSPSAINTGCCDDFAYELECRFPSGRAIWGDDCPHYFETNVDNESHCFFHYGNKFYDSETPNGVTRPDDLPFYKRAAKYRPRS